MKHFHVNWQANIEAVRVQSKWMCWLTCLIVIPTWIYDNNNDNILKTNIKGNPKSIGKFIVAI